MTDFDTDRPTETVLLVDDNEEARRAMERTLAIYGYEVLTASSPREAMEVARDHPGAIHLLVTDVVMPDGTGVALSTELVKLRPTLRVLFVSGYTDREVSAEELEGPPTGFLQKPMSIRQLAEAVREVLDRGTQDLRAP